jgi:translation initiation factor 2A
MKNLQVWNVKTKELVLGFTLKNLADWKVEWTEDEAICARMASNEVQLFESKDFKKGVSSKIQIDGIQSFSLSPGKRQVIALFIAGKNVIAISKNREVRALPGFTI